jgi:hypothetical protein
MLAGALTVAGLVGGCGGGSDEATASLTKAQFVKKANAICDKAEKRIQSELGKLSKQYENNPPTTKAANVAAQAAIAEAVVLPARRLEAEEITDLGAPSGEQDRIGAIVAALEAGLKEIEADPTKAAEAGASTFGEAWDLTRAYGLYGCA